MSALALRLGLNRTTVVGLAGPILIVLILAMMVLPLPPFAARPAVHLQHRAGADGDAGRRCTCCGRSTSRRSRRCCCSRRCCACRSTSPRRAWCCCDGHTGAGRGGQGDRGLRPLPGRRQLRRRPRRVRDPGGHQLRRRHQGRRAHRRGRRALHPGRDAGQADGDRRRPERRPDRRGRGRAGAAPEIARGGRLLRLDGRCQQVRARRRRRRHPDPVHQHRRRLRHRRGRSTT